jgi:protein phosphatase 2C family protein 2/3
MDSEDEANPYIGPYRVFPGRLSVCRTFGDCEAKIQALGGMESVVTCEPDIVYEKNGVNKYDWIMIGSDGIFDKLRNEKINKIIWDITTFQRT